MLSSSYILTLSQHPAQNYFNDLFSQMFTTQLFFKNQDLLEQQDILNKTNRSLRKQPLKTTN